MSEMTIITMCSNMGLSGAQVFINKTSAGFEARQAVDLFGSYQMHEDDLAKIDYNPFHDDFDDNFVSGKGNTQDEAIEALKVDAKQMADSLWVEF